MSSVGGASTCRSPPGGREDTVTADERRLPGLVDCKGLENELGVKRAAADAIMRQVPRVEIEGPRKWYVRREDVRRYLDEHTITPQRLS
jgi:hypothetical protein